MTVKRGTASLINALLLMLLVSTLGASSAGAEDAPPTLAAPELHREGLVVPLGSNFDSGEVGAPAVLFDEGQYKMWYHGRPANQFWQIGYATSSDGRSWTRRGVVVSPALDIEGSATTYPEVIKVQGAYWMWYSAWNGNYRILTAQSSDGISWTKHGVAIDLGSPGEPDDYYVWEPSVVYDGDTFRMWYSGRQAGGPTSTFLAESQDGISWTKRGPVLDPGRADSPDAQGARDPTVRRWGSGLVMVYTGLSSDGGWRLCLAFSEDGVSWERQGIILDLGGSEESQHLANANLLRESDGSWDVYYNARGSVFQIFLATMTLDETGPTFEGAREVTDLGAGNVRIDWEAATDPSLPIRYEVFVDTDPTELGIEVPVAVSGDTSVEVEGLRVDHTYHVWVRATDALGNPDANTVVIDFRVTAPTWDVRAFSWLMPALIGAIVSVLVVVLLRRRRKDQEERHQGADRR